MSIDGRYFTFNDTVAMAHAECCQRAFNVSSDRPAGVLGAVPVVDVEFAVLSIC